MSFISLKNVTVDIPIYNSQSRSLKKTFMGLASGGRIGLSEKGFSIVRSLSNINLEIGDGERVGLLGPNGAGKSTTMNMITGYISSTSGTAMVDGYDILKEPAEVKKRIGYLPEQPPLYMDMTVNEYLAFAADIKKVSRKNRKEHLDRIKELVRITDVGSRIIGLSLIHI